MTAYRITEIGLDRLDAIFLKTAVELASGLDMGQWSYVEEPDADVVLVNTDLESGQAVLQRNNTPSQNGRPVVISFSEAGNGSCNSPQSLTKPITYKSLVSLLLELERVLSGVVVAAVIVDVDDQQEQEANESENSDDMYSVGMLSEESVDESNDLAEAAKQSGQEDSDTLHEHTDEDECIKFEKPQQQEEYIQLDGTNMSSPDKDLTRDAQIFTELMGSKILEDNDTVKRDKETLLDLDRPARRFFADTRLLGLINESINRQQATEIVHSYYPRIRVYPKQKIYALPLGVTLIPGMFRTSAVEFITHDLAKVNQEASQLKWQMKPLWAILFIATLYGSEGRLRENYNPYDKLRLVIDPEFDMILDHPEFKAIADVMKANEALDLKSIADGAEVAIKTVIDFCNACEEIRLIERLPLIEHDEIPLAVTSTNTLSDIPIPNRFGEKPQSERERGFLKRIKTIFKNARFL